jgi:hypothetical protein
MRVSRVQAAENRQTVINVASRLFRERGFDGIGLKDLMKGAGLTQGAAQRPHKSSACYVEWPLGPRGEGRARGRVPECLG